MRTNLVILMFGLIIFTSSGLRGQEAQTSLNTSQDLPSQKDTSSEASPYVEKDQRQFAFYPGGKIKLTAEVPGNLKIVGWQRSSVLIEIERIFFHMSEAEAKLLSAQYPFQLRWTQTSATVRTAGPARSGAAMETNLVIYVPKDKTDLEIQVTQGDLALGGINGWVEATLKEGGIEAKSLSGYFLGTTKQGDLDFEFSGPTWNGHSFSAVTEKGAVQLRLPSTYSASLALETRDGNISADYPEQIIDGKPTPLLVVSKKKAQSLMSPVGKGGPPIKALTFSGDISLLRGN